MLMDQIPAVVKERRDGDRCSLADAPALVVILVSDDGYAVGRDGD